MSTCLEASFDLLTWLEELDKVEEVSLSCLLMLLEVSEYFLLESDMEVFSFHDDTLRSTSS